MIVERPDDFRIALTVRHPSLDPSAISTSLGVEPQFKWRVGDLAGNRVRNSTVWHGTLAEGCGANDFERALGRVLSMLTDWQSFLSEIKPTGGDLELAIKAVAEPQEGKAAEISLHPLFLEPLARLGVTLVLELWRRRQTEDNVREEPGRGP